MHRHLLHQKLERDLRRGDVVGLRDSLDGRERHDAAVLARRSVGASTEWRVGHVRDLMGVAICNRLVVVIANGHGALVDGRRPHARLLLQRLELLDAEVGDANRGCLAGGLGIFEGAPCLVD